MTRNYDFVFIFKGHHCVYAVIQVDAFKFWSNHFGNVVAEGGFQVFKFDPVSISGVSSVDR